jgi:hypothetical protein
MQLHIKTASDQVTNNVIHFLVSKPPLKDCV